MKVLITGASGLLGRAVHQTCLEKKHEVRALAFTRSDPAKGLTRLDLTDNDALVACLVDFAPDLIIHTAAERRPDVVENDPAACDAINVAVPANLAKAAAELPSVPLLINISTDYVFDGSKPPYKVDDEPNPLNAYGVSKLQGERAIAQHGAAGRFTNLRVPVLYGRTTTNNESAVNVLLDAITPPTGASAMCKCDAYAVRYPTNVQDIATAILALADVHAESAAPVPPITHFSAKEAMTKYDMCMVLSRIANAVGLETRTDLLDPEYDVDPLATTARPRHCKLDTSVLEQYGVPIIFTSFEDWWRPYLTEKYEEKLAEETRLRAEAEARRKQEEDATRKREEEEAAKRQQKLEEEKVEQEKQRKREQEQEQERRAKEEAEALSQHSTPPPDEEALPTADPGSPHPSFNSLKARPTPPATSGLPSPTSTHHASSIRSGHQPDGQHQLEPAEKVEVLDLDQASSTTTATPTGSVVRDSPLNLAAARERERLGQRVGSANNGDAKRSSLTDESTMFGGSVHASSTSNTTLLSTQTAARRSSADRRQHESEDEYGQPSPREPQAEFAPSSTVPQPTDAATNVEADTVAATEPAPETQSKIYHRPSFDLLQDARDREAYERLHRRKYEFSIKVGDPQKIGDPMTAHIVYTVRSHTNSLAFRASHFSVLRRYRDFRWLHAALVQNNPGIIVPPVPEKVSIGRFAAELVEARRMGLETCINKIASHPLLQQDDDFRLFLESENFAADVKHRDLIKGPIETPEQKTYKSWGSVLFGNVVSSSSSLSSGALSAFRFEEMDEWFNEQRLYLDSLENALKGLVKSISALSVQRKHIVGCTQHLSDVLLTLSGSSLSRSLSTCFAGLAEVERRLWELEDGQAEIDVRLIGTTMYEYERVVGSVRKAFQTRTEIWARSARADDEVRRTRTRFDKYKQTNPTSAGPQFQMLLAELTEAETKALEAERLFATVTRRCKEEMERLDLERVLDFKRIVTSWLDDMIARQEEVVSEWVQYCALLSRQTGIQVLTPPPQQQQQVEGQNGSHPPSAVSAAAPSQQNDTTDSAAPDQHASTPPVTTTTSDIASTNTANVDFTPAVVPNTTPLPTAPTDTTTTPPAQTELSQPNTRNTPTPTDPHQQHAH